MRSIAKSAPRSLSGFSAEMSFRKNPGLSQASAKLSDNMGMIEHLTSQFHRRATAANVGLDREDIRQEVMLVWWTCSQTFEASKGKFSTFMYMAARRRFNRIFDVEFRITNKVGLQSSTMSNEDGDYYLHDIVPTGEPQPDTLAMGRESYDALYDALSPSAKMVLDYVHTPPEFLLNELKAVNAKAEMGREQGRDMRRQTSVTISLAAEAVGRVMSLTAGQVHHVKSELTQISRFL